MIYYVLQASRTLFFFNDTATTEIYTLSLHDALPISSGQCPRPQGIVAAHQSGNYMRVGIGRRSGVETCSVSACARIDRKSTRLNSSHHIISYAVFCLKKKGSARCGRHRADQWQHSTL